MSAGEATEEGSSTVRFVSGLGALPDWIRDLDGYAIDVAAGVLLLLTFLWIFWLW